MARFTRIQVAQTMHEQGMVPLFYHANVELGKQALAACYRGGARLLEFTNRGDFAHEVFAELNKYALRELPGMMLGAGSVADAGTAALFIQLGATFIVSPSLREDVALTCNRRKILYSPGCGSLTEIGRAEELGCEIVKLFPGDLYGPNFIKAIQGPQPWTSIMPTGGVSPTKENLTGWFGAGAVCVGMGSQLISSDILKNGDFDKLETRVREALALIKKIRQA
ncbi:MAG: bifunctional 4-hydroxy-2-oxoglutarate aldolase/2-dehydro-3-deoxy-phosphogluconate aldolase [Lewinellaceae bacterium]|nr:bifunctional 4-hydroxy-2-oxoglutarate aldolase/2-dehydro-3-deoxy-phosphogluconate aldolase [Saprospiraceae bacterium]MCB9339812.1 bifunctional 4-hydroxy-2-oxoglutarate aldolase/2-dehydro-3-deoxy-phosphogluconate aldolase [Lewinellaceae bacterium]